MTASATVERSVAAGRHRVAEPERTTTRRLVREQAVVVVGQGLAGIGNMAFSLLAAHGLPSGEFAQLATFLALYLLLLVPSAGLAAAAAANPDAALRGRGIAIGSAVVGAGILAASAPIGHVLHLDTGLVALLGLAFPAVTLLAVVRGRLYGKQRQVGAVATLVTEPVVRLGAGAVLLGTFGALGAAVAVVLGGWLALAIGAIALRRHVVGESADRTAPAATGTSMIVVFLALSLLQNLDVILANRLLSAGAGTFAAVSTLGGISAFATATIPLVLLPRMRPDSGDSGRALAVALGAAGLLGGAIVLVAAVAGRGAYAAALGERYAGIAHVAVPYLGAMALFGVARVLAARLCSTGLARAVLPLVWAAVALQSIWILLAARTPTGVATGTELAVIMLGSGLGAIQAVRSLTGGRRDTREVLAQCSAPEAPAAPAAAAEPTAELAAAPTDELPVAERPAAEPASPPSSGRRGDWPLLLVLAAIAATLRCLVTRGLWVDEATSVAEVRMPYAGMLHTLRTTDVHPPGYFTLLWGWIRVFGDGAFAVRVPSILLGVALVPAVYFATRELFDRRTARIAAVLSVVAPQAVWYSQEARMYSLFMLLVVLAVWAQARILRTGSWAAWGAYTLASAALVYTQYFTTLVILSQQVVFVWLAVRRRRAGRPLWGQFARWAVSAVVLLALIAPLVPFAWQQFAANQAAGKGFGAPTNTGLGASATPTGPSVYSLLANFVWAAVGYHSDAVMTELGATWPLAMLLVLLLLGRGRSTRTLMVAVVGFLPLFLLYGVGQVKAFLFDMRYFIGVVPLLVVLVARAISLWPVRRAGTAITASLVAVALSVGLYDQQVNGENPRRYDFSPALSQIAQAAAPNSDVVLSPAYLQTVSTYYQPELHFVLDQGGTSDVVQRARSGQVFVLGSFFSNGDQRQHVKQLVAALAKGGRHVVHVWSFDNVKVWELQ